MLGTSSLTGHKRRREICRQRNWYLVYQWCETYLDHMLFHDNKYHHVYVHNDWNIYVSGSSYNLLNLKIEWIYRIINNITGYEQVSLNAIDYVTSTLVNETCEVLQDIVDQVILPINRVQAFNMIHSCKYFLKHKYSSH